MEHLRPGLPFVFDEILTEVEGELPWYLQMNELSMEEWREWFHWCKALQEFLHDVRFQWADYRFQNRIQCILEDVQERYDEFIAAVTAAFGVLEEHL